MFIVLAMAAVIGTGLVGAGCEKEKSVAEEAVAVEADPQAEQVTLKFTGLVRNIEPFEVNFEEGLTAYDVLKQAAYANGLALETKDYDFGMAVERIGSRRGGENNRYWLYYINGQPAQVAVNVQELQAGDEVEFRFE